MEEKVELTHDRQKYLEWNLAKKKSEGFFH